MTSAILLLAAGASRRFGTDNKLLAPLDGRPLLRHAADAALTVPADLHLSVVCDDRVAEVLPDFRKVIVSPGQPQSDSLKAGVAVAQAMKAARVLVVLGDMPRVSANLMSAVLLRGRTGLAAASDGDRLAPPVCLPASLFPKVMALSGDQSAGALLRDLTEDQRVPAGPGTLIDIDTEADLRALAQP